MIWGVPLFQDTSICWCVPDKVRITKTATFSFRKLVNPSFCWSKKTYLAAWTLGIDFLAWIDNHDNRQQAEKQKNIVCRCRSYFPREAHFLCVKMRRILPIMILIWGLPKMGIPHFIIPFNGILHEINHPAIGDPPLMETPIYVWAETWGTAVRQPLESPQTPRTLGGGAAEGCAVFLCELQRCRFG